MRSHRKITAPDKEHLHHRLLDLGHTHRHAVLLMYLWSALISASALAVALIKGWRLVGIIFGGMLVVFLVTAVPRARRAGVTGWTRRNGGGKHRPRVVAGTGNGSAPSDAHPVGQPEAQQTATPPTGSGRNP